MPPLTPGLSPSLIMTNVMNHAGRKAQPAHVPIYCMVKHLVPPSRGAQAEV